MMIYLQNSSKLPFEKRNRNNRIFYACVILVVLIVILIQTFAPQIFPSIVNGLFSPFWRMQFAVESGLFKSQPQLLNENAELRRQIEEMNLRMENISNLEQENIDIKSQFGRTFSDKVATTSTSTISKNIKTSDTRDFVLSAVLSRPHFTPYDELIIDIGSDFNVDVGDKVYASKSIPIGRISEVFAHTAKVILYTSPGETHEVLIGSSNSSATAIGKGGGQYSAELPRAVNVSNGDLVTSPSIQDKPFAIVQDVEKDPAKAFETVLFSPLVNIYELKWVFVNRNDKK